PSLSRRSLYYSYLLLHSTRKPLFLPLPSFILLFFFLTMLILQFFTLSLHDALPISSQAAPCRGRARCHQAPLPAVARHQALPREDRKSTRLNSSHLGISYAVFCLKKKRTLMCVLFVVGVMSFLCVSALIVFVLIANI